MLVSFTDVKLDYRSIKKALNNWKRKKDLPSVVLLS